MDWAIEGWAHTRGTANIDDCTWIMVHPNIAAHNAAQSAYYLRCSILYAQPAYWISARNLRVCGVLNPHTAKVEMKHWSIVLEKAFLQQLTHWNCFCLSM